MLTVVVPSFGEPGNHYSRYVARWWRAVEAMNPRPTEIVVAHSQPEPLGIMAAAPPSIAIRAVPVAGARVEDFVNAGVCAATQAWVSCIGVDDLYKPDCMIDLPIATAMGVDIMVWNQEELGSHIWHCFWSPEKIRHANTLAGSCPFRRDLWHRVGGFPSLGWSDWGFWMLAAAAGAKAWHCNRIGVVFDPGRDHATWSGKQLSHGTKVARDAEIKAYGQRVFL